MLSESKIKMEINKDRELAYLEQALQHNPSETQILTKIAWIHTIKSNLSEASDYYSRIANIDKSNINAWIALGHCYLIQEQYQQSFAAYKNAVSCSEANKDAQLWYGIGLLYYQLGKLQQALQSFQTVLELQPEFCHKQQIQYKLGIILKRTQDYKRANKHFKSCPNLDKTFLNFQKGFYYTQMGKYEKSIQFYQKALKRDKNNCKTYQCLAWAHSQLENYHIAHQYLEAVRDLAQDNDKELGDIYYLIGRIYLMEKDYQEGQAAFQKAIFKNSDAYTYWCSIGILYALAKQATDAFECFVRASNLVKDRPELWYNMGALYENCDQHHEARLAYQRAIELDSDYLDANSRIEIIEQGQRPQTQGVYQHPPIYVGEQPIYSNQKIQVTQLYYKKKTTLKELINVEFEDIWNPDKVQSGNQLKIEQVFALSDNLGKEQKTQFEAFLHSVQRSEEQPSKRQKMEKSEADNNKKLKRIKQQQKDKSKKSTDLQSADKQEKTPRNQHKMSKQVQMNYYQALHAQAYQGQQIMQYPTWNMQQALLQNQQMNQQQGFVIMPGFVQYPNQIPYQGYPIQNALPQQIPLAPYQQAQIPNHFNFPMQDPRMYFSQQHYMQNQMAQYSFMQQSATRQNYNQNHTHNSEDNEESFELPKKRKHR